MEASINQGLLLHLSERSSGTVGLGTSIKQGCEPQAATSSPKAVQCLDTVSKQKQQQTLTPGAYTDQPCVQFKQPKTSCSLQGREKIVGHEQTCGRLSCLLLEGAQKEREWLLPATMGGRSVLGTASHKSRGASSNMLCASPLSTATKLHTTGRDGCCRNKTNNPASSLEQHASGALRA